MVSCYNWSMSMRKCKKCSAEFEQGPNSRLKCPSCHNQQMKDIRAAKDPIKLAEEAFNHALWTKFRLRRDVYDQMLSAQKGLCGSCQGPNTSKRSWHVDHDHSCCPGAKSCGKCVRGLLCHQCNVALGHVNDSVPKLRALIQYLEFDRMSNSGID